MNNAQKIQTWRDANPNTQMTEQILLKTLGVDSLHNSDLTDAFLSCADLRGVDLSDATLTGANLRDAYLTGADLRRAYLTDADLTRATLTGADLTGATLTDADLRGADLTIANLWGTNLMRANLWRADLTCANLTRANLMSANLSYCTGGVIQIENVYPYPATLQPTPNGWHTRVGCLYGTLEDLYRIVTSDNDDEWPEARGEEREQRRPLLQAILTVFDAHVANCPDIINRLDNQWRD